MNVYTDLRAVDLVDAVEAIPNPLEVLALSEQRATGTDGRKPDGGQFARSVRALVHPRMPGRSG